MTDFFYNKKAEPISAQEFDKLFGDMSYRRIGYDEIGGVRVSTIWMGVNYNFMDGPPILFETMVFAGGDWREDIMERWFTEREAVIGHAKYVAMVREMVESLAPKEADS